VLQQTVAEEQLPLPPTFLRTYTDLPNSATKFCRWQNLKSIQILPAQLQNLLAEFDRCHINARLFFVQYLRCTLENHDAPPS
jgi:hypothetical protein